jgi:hypothetical protein
MSLRRFPWEAAHPDGDGLRTMSMTVWYLYAVASARDVTGLDLPSGIDGVPVQCVAAGDLAAVVGAVDPAVFHTARAKTDLTENCWLAGALRAPDRVVRRVFAQIPLVPLRFGALVEGGDGLAEALGAQRESLRAALDVAGDTAEWRVRLVPHRLSEVDTAEAVVPAGGTAWMMARLRAARTREAEHERWLRLAGKVHGMLSVYALQTYGRVPAARDVYLVRRHDENAFSTAAFSLAGLLSGTAMKLEISGPRPPYHLASGAWRP